jgi:hypothetical protein
MLMSLLGHHIRVCDDLFVYVKADLHFATSCAIDILRLLFLLKFVQSNEIVQNDCSCFKMYH